MSRGRMLDAIFLGVGLFVILFAQAATVPLMDTTKDVVLEQNTDVGDYEGAEFIHGAYAMVTKWVPTAVGGGLIVMAVYREYRRQKLAGVRGAAGGGLP